jgi:hypothetical protein
MFQFYMQIVLYRPNGGLGCAVGDSPPGIPEEGADAIYSFESLPAKHWKKYVYASRYRDCVVPYHLSLMVLHLFSLALYDNVSVAKVLPNSRMLECG